MWLKFKETNKVYSTFYIGAAYCILLINIFCHLLYLNVLKHTPIIYFYCLLLINLLLKLSPFSSSNLKI